MFKFDNTYCNLPKQFYSVENPLEHSSPSLVFFNKQLAAELGCDLSKLGSEQELAKIFSGSQALEGVKPISMAYAGHQFGRFVPSLGDGRAILLGEVLNTEDQRFDIQLKGAGQTHFSRRGDGRATIGSVLRESLVSEAMHSFGIPTTRSLAVTLTGDRIAREGSVTAGVFTRVSPSHIRVGTFEYFANRGDMENLEILLKYSAKRHYPEISDSSDLALDFFKIVLKKQVTLIADWMSLGFIHGVMNTDNTSVAGVTIDYGPCAFMDRFEFNKVFSSIDRNGRYSYGNQPNIAKWNLAKLAEALLALYPEDKEKGNKKKNAFNAFTEQISSFGDLFVDSWIQKMGAKLGLAKPVEQDQELINSWLNFLEENKLDFTLSHYELSKTLENGSLGNLIITQTKGFKSFKEKWSKRLASQQECPQEIMNKKNPVYIPRNHQIEQAIKKANEGDFNLFHLLSEVLSKPFDEQPRYKEFITPPKTEQIVHRTFCGT